MDGLRGAAQDQKKYSAIVADALPVSSPMWKSAPFPPPRENDGHLGYTLGAKIAVISSNLAADARASSRKRARRRHSNPVRVQPFTHVNVWMFSRF